MKRKIFTWLRRALRRCTRQHRYMRAVFKLSGRLEGWNMTEAEDAEYWRVHHQFFRDFDRLDRLGKKWGYR